MSEEQKDSGESPFADMTRRDALKSIGAGVGMVGAISIPTA